LSPRTFKLLRIDDETGVSGIGHVAYGVRWPDGSVSMRWIGSTPSFVNYEGIPPSTILEREGDKHVEIVHGHAGKTRLVYDNE
jgi:hypothetical protein